MYHMTHRKTLTVHLVLKCNFHFVSISEGNLNSHQYRGRRVDKTSVIVLTRLQLQNPVLNYLHLSCDGLNEVRVKLQKMDTKLL